MIPLMLLASLTCQDDEKYVFVQRENILKRRVNGDSGIFIFFS
jgi:hypothetical protein